MEINITKRLDWLDKRLDFTIIEREYTKVQMKELSQEIVDHFQSQLKEKNIKIKHAELAKDVKDANIKILESQLEESKEDFINLQKEYVNLRDRKNKVIEAIKGREMKLESQIETHKYRRFKS